MCGALRFSPREGSSKTPLNYWRAAEWRPLPLGLRHVIRELSKHLDPKGRADKELQELFAYGCATVMHVVPLSVPRLHGEDHTKDIDFTPAGIGGRREAGYAATRDALARAPWRTATDPDSVEGVIIHEPPG